MTETANSIKPRFTIVPQRNGVIYIQIDSGAVVGHVFPEDPEDGKIIGDNLADSGNLFRETPIDYTDEMESIGLTIRTARQIANVGIPDIRPLDAI